MISCYDLERFQLESNTMKSEFRVVISFEHMGLSFLALRKSKKYMRYINDFLTGIKGAFELPFMMDANVEHAEDTAGRINDRVNKRRFGELKQIFQLWRLYAKKRLDGKFFPTLKSCVEF